MRIFDYWIRAGGSTASKYLMKKEKVILIEEGEHFKVNQFKGSMSKSLSNVWRNAGVTTYL